MNKTLTLWLALAVIVALFALNSTVEAKRMGGGKSVGQQSSTVTKPQATPPAQNAVPAKPQAAPAPAAAPAPTARPWGAMLGGMAAGLGLAWLASSLGFGEAFGNIMMALLLGGIAVAAVSWFLRRKHAEPEHTATGTRI